MSTTVISTTQNLSKPEASFSKSPPKPHRADRIGVVTPGEALVQLVGGKKPEAMGFRGNGTFIGAKANDYDMPGVNPFAEAANLAFDRHYPFAFGPDDVWLCIAQGFAAHVKANAEELRSRFVKHDGKEKIKFMMGGVKGSANTDWPTQFSRFSEKIAERIGKTRDLIIADFSTTTGVERAATELVLMDAMSSYFSYEVGTDCGIPAITLGGTVEDWKSVRARAAVLGEYGLSWWTDHLIPVLDKLVAAAGGNSQPEFWESFYKESGGSGGPYVNGWFNVLFPYIKGNGSLVQNALLTRPTSGFGYNGGFASPGPCDFPTGVSTIDFVWNYYGTEYPMEFLSGFVGVLQDEDSLTVSPSVGWAVRDK